MNNSNVYRLSLSSMVLKISRFFTLCCSNRGWLLSKTKMISYIVEVWLPVATGSFLRVIVSWMKSQKRKWHDHKNRISKFKWVQTNLLNLKVSEYILRGHTLINSATRVHSDKAANNVLPNNSLLSICTPFHHHI